MATNDVIPAISPDDEPEEIDLSPLARSHEETPHDAPDSPHEDDRPFNDKKLFSCPHCRYLTDRKNNLKRHIVTMHESCTKVLECCDVVFANKAALRDHVISYHRKGYDCRVCGRNFCRKALLKRHITVHSGQKDFVCDICGYATSHKSNLDRHKRRHLRLQGDTEHFSKPLEEPEERNNKLTDFSIDSILSKSPKIDSKIGSYESSFSSWSRRFLAKKRQDQTNNDRFGRHLFDTRQDQSLKHRAVSHSVDPFKYHLINKHYSQHQGALENFLLQAKHSAYSPTSGFMAPPMSGPAMREYNNLIRRLFPAVYKCKICDVTFEKQSQYLQHLHMVHSPPRPLTSRVQHGGLAYMLA